MTYALNQMVDTGFTDARHVGATTEALTGNYIDEAGLDTALAGAPFSISAANLASMTINDKIYALRMASDPLSFGTAGTTSGMS
jgi:hypothetical protein